MGKDKEKFVLKSDLLVELAGPVTETLGCICDEHQTELC